MRHDSVTLIMGEGLDSGVKAKLAVKGLGGFAVSPSHDRPLIAAYIPEAKGSPGFVGVWDLAGLTKSPESPPPLARRSFFRVSQPLNIVIQ